MHSHARIARRTASALAALLLGTLDATATAVAADAAAPPPALIACEGASAVSATAGDLPVSCGGSIADLSRETKAEDAARLFQLLGRAAMNVGGDDLFLSVERLRALSKTGVPLVSSNLVLSGGGERVVAPRLVVAGLGGRRVGIVGVTRAEAAGVDTLDPAKALAEVLPALEKEADLVVLLADLDREDAAAIVRGLPAVRLCIVPGRGVLDPEPLLVGGCWLVMGPPAEAALARITPVPGDKGALRSALRESVAAPRPSSEARALIDAAGLGAGPLTRSLATPPKGGAPSAVTQGAVVASPAPEARPDGPVPLALEGERVAPLSLVRRSRAVLLTLHGVSRRASFGAVKASPGKALVVVDAEWRNVTPRSYAFERETPPAYLVGSLDESLYVVANGAHLARRIRGDEAGGGIMGEALSLPRIGATARAALVYEVPDAPLESLDLRFYDYAHGCLEARILGPAVAPRPLAEPRRNAMIEASLEGARLVRAHGGVEAPEGSRLLVALLRGVSLASYAADATAFDPAAKAGEMRDIGCVTPWPDPRGSIKAFADGETECPLAEGFEVPESPRMLPGMASGFEVVFVVPEAARSLEVRAVFPMADVPGKEAIQVDPLVFPVRVAAPGATK